MTINRRTFVTAVACLCTTGSLFPASVFAKAPLIKTQAPGYHRALVGDFEVTALSDGTAQMSVMKLLQGDPDRIAEALKRNYLGVQVETSYNAFLINTGSRLVLIDSGAGKTLVPGTGHLIASLHAAGYGPEQVDEVYITHMHPDHVGGLTADGRPTYPNAIVRVSQRDADYWLSDASIRAPSDRTRSVAKTAVASFSPYLRAGNVKTFDGDRVLIPGIRALSAYGHTPGHTTYLVESRGETLLLWGDTVHVASVQFEDPSITITYDYNNVEAAQQRLKIFADAAHNGWLVGGAHLAFPGLGHLRTDGENVYSFVSLNYSTVA
ncbi:MBL fold metallo-hydrolase [Burkholderia sp. ABCPW 11]|nr:MBL fold metallo-hydrolase [Burkholderia sp. ABCPW 11]